MAEGSTLFTVLLAAYGALLGPSVGSGRNCYWQPCCGPHAG